MGDHFVLLVDRLLTESTLGEAIGSMNPSYDEDDRSGSTSETTVQDSCPTMTVDGSSVGHLYQCRICHDDDEESNMESPCSCCGSLKYAHRKCVQQWCNEKGNTICEICLQQFKSGYTAPPPQMFHYSGVAMNLRGNWEISRHDLNNPGLLFATDPDPSDHYTYDHDSSSTARSVLYCRSVIVIFMVLLVLRHALPIIISEEENYSFEMFAILLLRVLGILVPIYAMARALSLIHCSRQRRQHVAETHGLPVAISGDEHVSPRHPQQLQSQPHLIHIQ